MERIAKMVRVIRWSVQIQLSIIWVYLLSRWLETGKGGSFFETVGSYHFLCSSCAVALQLLVQTLDIGIQTLLVPLQTKFGVRQNDDPAKLKGTLVPLFLEENPRLGTCVRCAQRCLGRWRSMSRRFRRKVRQLCRFLGPNGSSPTLVILMWSTACWQHE